MEDKIFVDSNIWLYAFMEDGEKKKAAAAIILKKKCILSTQVVNEVCVNLIKKADYGEEDVSKLVENLYSKYQIEIIDKDVILKSSTVRTNMSVYLYKRKRDQKEIFTIKKKRHAEYWQNQAYPVMLVIRTSDEKIRWMNITEYLKRKGPNTKQIEFEGEPFTAESLCRLRKRLLG